MEKAMKCHFHSGGLQQLLVQLGMESKRNLLLIIPEGKHILIKQQKSDPNIMAEIIMAKKCSVMSFILPTKNIQKQNLVYQTSFATFDKARQSPIQTGIVASVGKQPVNTRVTVESSLRTNITADILLSINLLRDSLLLVYKAVQSQVVSFPTKYEATCVRLKIFRFYSKSCVRLRLSWAWPGVKSLI